MAEVFGGRLPSRRVLEELRPWLPATDSASSPVVHAYDGLASVLSRHAETLVACDRAESAFIAAQAGLEPGDLPRDVADGQDLSSEVAGSPGSPRRRRHKGVLASKRRAFVTHQEHETRLAREVGAVTERLLSAPIETCADLAIKLAVIIAAGEAGSPDAIAFPWADLRRLLAELLTLEGSAP